MLVGALETVAGVHAAGRVYVFSGADGSWLRTFVSPGPVVTGHFGRALAGVADVDGDGVSDVLVGAPWEGLPGDAGRAYLVSAASGAILRTLQSPAPQFGGLFGDAVVGVPDTDGDGVVDLLIRARGEGAFPVLESGRCYLFSGASGTLLHAFQTPLPTLFGHFGFAVCGAPDLDGDERGDVAIGAILEASGGRVYVHSGATGALLGTLAPPGAGGQHFGWAVAGLADVTGDGRGELLVGSPREGPGRTYLFSGAHLTPVAQLRSPAPSGGGDFGTAVAAVGDTGGDGFPDLLIGAPAEHGVALSDGRAYLLSGVGAELSLLTPPDVGTAVHFSVASPGDAALPYLCAFSMGTSPGLPLGDGAVVPLAPDALFALSLAPASPFFHGTIGTLSSSGLAVVVVDVPPIAELVGITVFGAFVVIDGSTRSGVGTISAPLAIEFQ